MGKYAWIEQIDSQKFAMPFVVKHDADYLPAVKNKLLELTSELKRCGASDNVIHAIKDYCNDVVSSIVKYYHGFLIDAQHSVDKMIRYFVYDAPAVTHINDSFSFSGRSSDNSEVQFFRARLSDSVVEFLGDNMLHIPFNKRHIVKSERFSIPGLPCLYLSNSSYACWMELGCPADHQFNVAPILLDNTQYVLNLTVSMSHLYEFKDGEYPFPSADPDIYLIDLLKLFVLTLCTSYKVEESNRNFKSEYILSQMIMLACNNESRLDGIVYYSKQIQNESFAYNVGVNLVLFARFNGGEHLSDICQHLVLCKDKKLI